MRTRSFLVLGAVSLLGSGQEAAVTLPVALPDVVNACRVLFGPQIHVDGKFLAQLNAVALRRLFHKRAMEVHPDRAASLGRSPDRLAEDFKGIEAAYRVLCLHLAKQAEGPHEIEESVGPRCPSPAPRRPRGRRKATPSAPRSRSPHRRATSARVRNKPAVRDHFWYGPMPTRSLRLGEYLYYLGRISWRELIQALVWQAQQRPKFGQAAMELGYLDPQLISQALKYRRPGEKIGEAAVRLEILTALQRQVVLHNQIKAHRRIGDYFLDTGRLAPSELDQYARGMRAHNAKVARACR
jgi:hypothetical protein